MNPGGESSPFKIPRIGGHREIDHRRDLSPKSPLFRFNGRRHLINRQDGHSKVRNIFVIQIQLDDSRFDELRFADDSDIHDVSMYLAFPSCIQTLLLLLS